MARQVAAKEFNAFVKGLITEASALTFPENASVDEENFELQRDGSRKRRLGMGYEASNSLIDTGYASTALGGYAVTTHEWENVGENADISILIVQIGPKLFFFDLYKASLSGNQLNGGSAHTLGITGTLPIQTTESEGKLIITTGETYPMYLEYDGVADTISETNIQINIRDHFGVADGLPLGHRPATLSSSHSYNLINQGWSTQDSSGKFNISNDVSTFGSDPYIGGYPSNSDVYHYGKLIVPSTGIEGWYPNNYRLTESQIGNSQAPKGRMILDAFSRGASRNGDTSVSGLPTDAETGRPSSIIAHSGRIFYSGVTSVISGGDSKSPNYDGFIFFSRILRNAEDFGTCHQEADPTAEDINDLLPVDGGYINIAEAYGIKRMISIGNSLVILAENGIWEVHGGDLGFTADEYTISKITDLGCVSAESAVEVEDGIAYWSRGGIYMLAPDRISGRLSPTNITETTVQTYYNSIPAVAKENAVGVFDPIARKVSWMYSMNDAYDGNIFKQKFDTELHLDVVLSAFSKYTIDDTSPYLAGYVQIPDFATVGAQDDVVVNTDQVQVNGDDVYVDTTTRLSSSSTIKYVALASGTTYDFTFAHYNDSDFLDWVSLDYSSFLVTGYELLGDSIRDKQANYLFCHFNRTEDGYDSNLDLTSPSGCMVQAQWEWTDSANSGRWGTAFQAYRLTRPYFPSGISDTFDYGFSVITTKNKLRGKGKSLSIKFYSESGKDLQLLGWAVSGSGTTVP